jgi:hypothetical protein
MPSLFSFRLSLLNQEYNNMVLQSSCQFSEEIQDSKYVDKKHS